MTHLLYVATLILHPQFELFTDGNFDGVDNLDPNMTINGVTETPVFRYKGGDADGTDFDYWGYGETLTIQSGTAPSYNQGSPLLGTNDDSVKFNAGGYYIASGTSFADITTEDIVIEAVIKISAAGSKGVFSKRDNTSPYSGYTLYVHSNYHIQLVLDDGDSLLAADNGNEIPPNTWNHILVFADRSGSLQWYVNGDSSGSAISMAVIDESLTSPEELVVGAAREGLLPYDNNVAYIAMWKRNDWLDTHLQSSIAKERFEKLTGFYSKGRGTHTTIVRTRATRGYLDKLESGNRKLYQVGYGWLRNVHREDGGSNEIKGYLSEESSTNRADFSEDFNSGRSTAAVSILTNTVAAPNKETTGDTLHEDDSSGTHYISDVTGTSVTAGQNVIYSVWVKASNRTFIDLAFSGLGAFNDTTHTYFNLSTGAVGTDGADSSGIENWGDGWYRCWIGKVADNNGTVTYYTLIAEADNDNSFTGLDQDSLHLWGDQIEFNISYPTSYIYVPSVSDVTRNMDELRYIADDGNIKDNQIGMVTVNVLYPDYTSPTQRTSLAINDGGSSSDRVMIYMFNGNLAQVTTSATAGDTGVVTGTTDITSNTIYEIKSTYKTDYLVLFVNDTSEGTPDVTADMPSNLDRIDVGQSQATANQLNGVVSNIKIYNKPKRYP